MRFALTLPSLRLRSLMPVLALAACLAGLNAHAAPVWQESYDLAGELLGVPNVSVNGTVATVVMANQTVTNTGATAERLGMYFGWVWTRGGNIGPHTPLYWNNASGLFEGTNVTASITQQGAPALTLRIGDVLNDTWIGNPWTPDAALVGIATDADWIVPFFDFGMMAAGASASYDIELVFTFDTEQQVADFAGAGAFWAYAQGVQAVALDVPEPGSIALLGLGLLAVVAVRRRKI